MLKEIKLGLKGNQFATVKGHIIGNLGFHKQYGEQIRRVWQVTHILTGLAVIKYICSYKEARQVVLFLNKMHKWEFEKIKKPEDVFTKKQIDIINNIVREYSPILRLSTNSYTFGNKINWKGESFDVPNDDEINKMIMGNCYSINGTRCDPDGNDINGYPSWLSALGLPI